MSAEVAACDRRRREAGFGLIELFVVMLLIGILAAIALPQYFAQRQNAYEASTESDVRGAALTAETFFTAHSIYPHSGADLTDGSEPAFDADGAHVGGGVGNPFAPSSADVSLTYTVDDDGLAYCIVADHDLIDDDVDAAYDSNGGGLVDACS